MKRILLFGLAVLMSYSAISQSVDIDRKACKLFDQALSSYNLGNFDEAFALSSLAVKFDPGFVDAYLMLSDISKKKSDTLSVVKYLESALAVDDNNQSILISLANYCCDAYFLEKAAFYYSDLLTRNGLSQKIRDEAVVGNQTVKFRSGQLAHPLDINPVNLGPNINTRYNEYFPSLTADSKTLVYTIELPQTSQNPFLPLFQEDIYISKRNSDSLPMQQARSIGTSVNTSNNEGAPYISSDGKYLFFTSCTCNDGTIRCCDIYYSINGPDGYSAPHPLPAPVNTSYWESQPCMSATQNQLWFVSNRPGGFGGKDIWYSDLKEDGSWSEAVNAGPEINTAGDEESPFLHADGKTLYFSSTGFIGMGKADLFISRADSTGKRLKPENLGYPVNTGNQETRIVVTPDGNKAIISSNRLISSGFDLYEITLPENIRPKFTSRVEGLVYDSITQKPICAKFIVKNLISGETVQTGVTPCEYVNIFLFLPQGGRYALNATAPGYLPQSKSFNTQNLSDTQESVFIKLPMLRPESGQSMILDNVFFDTDSYDINPESYFELDMLAQYLNDNPGLKGEIGGHTDNTGNQNHNSVLSSRRAQSVLNYLISKGVDSKRISYHGYASQKPVSDNNTAQGRAKNRRTEFKIL